MYEKIFIPMLLHAPHPQSASYTAIYASLQIAIPIPHRSMTDSTLIPPKKRNKPRRDLVDLNAQPSIGHRGKTMFVHSFCPPRPPAMVAGYPLLAAGVRDPAALEIP